MLKQTFLPVITNFRKAAENNERETVEVAMKVLDLRQS